MKKNRRVSFKTEDTSKYDEMIPSMFNWITPDIQSKISKHLANVTKNEMSDEVSKK